MRYRTMKTIITKYHGCTNTLPIRISASSDELGKITMSRDSLSDDIVEAHRDVAAMFARSMGWMNGLHVQEFVTGYLDCGKYVHVLLPHNKTVVDKMEYELLKAANAAIDAELDETLGIHS